MTRDVTTRARPRPLPKIQFAVIIPVVVAVLAASCSSGEDGAGELSGGGGGGEGSAIEVNIYSRELPYFQEMSQALTAAAEERGWDLTITYGETDPSLQFEQIENAITRQPDGMVVVPVNREAPVPAILNAVNAGIPVVSIANNLSDEGMEALLGWVGNPYEEVGARKVEWIVDELGGEGTVGVIHGIRGNDFTESQAIGAAEEFAKHPAITVVEGGYGGAYSSDRGLELTENLLTANSNIDAIYYDNDDLALGGLIAVERVGIDPSDILLTGTDGGPPALDAVEAGDLDFTISLCGYASGLQAIEILEAALVDGEEPDEVLVRAPTLEFTPETIDELRPKTGTSEC